VTLKRCVRPSKFKGFKKMRKFGKHRDKCMEEDMLEAMQLLREVEYSMKAASMLLNIMREHMVPCVTLSEG
jgi:hypothetical protein